MIWIAPDQAAGIARRAFALDPQASDQLAWASGQLARATSRLAWATDHLAWALGGGAGWGTARTR